jgi:hypothetical protein
MDKWEVLIKIAQESGVKVVVSPLCPVAKDWRVNLDFLPYGKVYSKHGDCPVHLDPNAESDGL